MKKIVAFTLAGMSLVGTALAAGQNNVGCGLGSTVFGGQSGVAPQVMAATTNGTSGNQTFGISSGTLGCSQDGTVPAAKKMALFIEGNQDKLAADISVGRGESLAALASLVGITSADQATFAQTLKQNQAAIFTQQNIDAAQVQANLKAVLANSSFKAASTNI